MNFIRSIFLGDPGSYEIFNTPVIFDPTPAVISLPNGPFENIDYPVDSHVVRRWSNLFGLFYLHGFIHQLGYALADYLVRQNFPSPYRVQLDGFRRGATFDEVYYEHVIESIGSSVVIHPYEKTMERLKAAPTYPYYCHDWQKVTLRQKKIVMSSNASSGRVMVLGSWLGDKRRHSIVLGAGTAAAIGFCALEILLAKKLPRPFSIYLKAVALNWIFFEWIWMLGKNSAFRRIAKNSHEHLEIAVGIVALETVLALSFLRA